MTTTPRPAYIWDANSNDWAPLAGTVDTGQSYNFSAVENFNAGLTATSINGGGITGQNHLINGGMDVWQRGTSFAVGGTGAVFYSADRWTCYAGNTGTITRDTSLVLSGFESSIKFTSTINNSGIDFYQLIETKNVIPLQGKTVTLSAYVAGTNGKTTPGMTAYYSTTNDDMIYLTSGIVLQTVAVSSPLSSTSFQRVSMTFTVPATAKTIRIGLISGPLNNTEFINWTGAKLEIGTVATAFARVGGTITSEIAACQRYYVRWDIVNEQIGFYWGNGSTFNRWNWAFPVQMRSIPTIVKSGNIAAFNPVFTAQAITAIGGNYSGTKSASVDGSLAGAVGTNGQTYLAYILNSSQYVEASAEL